MQNLSCLPGSGMERQGGNFTQEKKFNGIAYNFRNNLTHTSQSLSVTTISEYPENFYTKNHASEERKEISDVRNCT